MNQDLETNILVDNNNEQPVEGSEAGSEEESEEGSEEVSEESSEDSSEEDQEEVVMPPKQSTRSTEGSTVGESSRASRKKLTPPLPKPKMESIQVPRAPSLDPDPDLELENDIKQILIVTSREVKIARLDLFYGDRKKLKIRNEQYKMILDKKGGSYFNRRKTNGRKDQGDLIELNVMKKAKTFKRKGKKHFEGKSKKGNSFGISLEELDKKRKNKLYFKYKLLGHIANTHKKDNKLSSSVKVRAIRILRIMDILSESSEEESLDKGRNSLEEEEEQPNLVTILEITVETDVDEIAMTRILETGSVLIRRTWHKGYPWNQGEVVSLNR
ncbi:hypothetical protein B7463_g9361, partial [Scytalidium lignicola]